MIIAFDLDDTLADVAGTDRRTRSRMCAGIAGQSGLPPARVVETYRAAMDRHLMEWEAQRRWATGTARAFRTAVYADVLRDLGLDPQRAAALAEAHEKVHRQELALFPDARPALERLRAAGHRLVLMANGPRDTLRAQCELLGIGGYFEALLFEGELGYGKPDLRVFRAVGPAAVLVGDSPQHDVAGARAAGWQAIWLNRTGRPYPAGLPAPDRTISTLDELEV